MLLVQLNLKSPNVSTLGWGVYLNVEHTWMPQVKGLHVKISRCAKQNLSVPLPTKAHNRCSSFSLKTHIHWQQQMYNVQN